MKNLGKITGSTIVIDEDLGEDDMSAAQVEKLHRADKALRAAGMSGAQVKMLRKAWKEWDAKAAHIRDRVSGALVFVMYCLFPSVITGLFKTFHCTEAIGETYGTASERYLVTDIGVQCFEGEHVTSMVIATSLLS